MSVKVNKCRINAYISKKNYKDIDELMRKEHLISMTLSKGAIIDLALSCLFNALESESLENIAIQHLERVEDDAIDKVLNPEGDDV